MIVSDPLLFAFSLVNTGAVLFLLVYFVITLSDLDYDYLNAQECCSKLNYWVRPKLIAHVLLMFLLLIHGHWILTLINIPMAAWMGYGLISIPRGNLGIYDPTEIYSHGQLKKHMKDCLINLAYYLLFFFAYLYFMIVSLLKGDPINREEGYDVYS